MILLIVMIIIDSDHIARDDWYDIVDIDNGEW